MAVSKKPRKKYNANNRPMRASALYISPEIIEETREMFTQPRLIVEYKLHRGDVTYNEAAIIRDFYNTAACWIVFLRDKTHELSPEWDAETLETRDRFTEFFTRWYRRGIEAGAVNNPDYRFICTADELNAIREGVHVLADVVDWVIQDRPHAFVKMFLTMKKYVNDRGGRVTISEENLLGVMCKLLRSDLPLHAPRPFVPRKH